MDSEARKAAIAAYKERKAVAGIYAVRCEESGEVWVGHWPDVTTVQTRLWFTLRRGGMPIRGLQEAWNRHGEAAFTFTVLETLKEDGPDYARTSALKARAVHWRSELNAGAM